MVTKVYADWRTAPVRPQVRAALGFLDKLVGRADDLTVADVDAVRAAGVSREALIGAVHVCAAFSTIVRLADAFEFEIPDDRAFEMGARQMIKRGYILP